MTDEQNNGLSSRQIEILYNHTKRIQHSISVLANLLPQEASEGGSLHQIENTIVVLARVHGRIKAEDNEE